MEGIEIRVTGATPLEVLARIGAFGMHCLANSDVCAAAQRIYEAEAHKEAAAKREAEQVNAQPANPPAPAATGAPTIATAAPTAPPVVPTYAPAPTSGPMVVPMVAPGTQGAPATPVTQASATAPTPSPSALSGQMEIASPSNPPTGAAPTGAPSYTLDDITRAGADFIVRNPDKQEMLNSLFPQFGITTLAELRPDQMGAFATAMRAMGVSI